MSTGSQATESICWQKHLLFFVWECVRCLYLHLFTMWDFMQSTYNCLLFTQRTLRTLLIWLGVSHPLSTRFCASNCRDRRCIQPGPSVLNASPETSAKIVWASSCLCKGFIPMTLRVFVCRQRKHQWKEKWCQKQENPFPCCFLLYWGDCQEEEEEDEIISVNLQLFVTMTWGQQRLTTNISGTHTLKHPHKRNRCSTNFSPHSPDWRLELSEVLLSMPTGGQNHHHHPQSCQELRSPPGFWSC